METFRKWYAKGGRHCVWAMLVLLVLLAGVWCLIRVIGEVCPTVVELAVPQSLHGAFHRVGLIGRTERVYYANGSLCYEKHFLPSDTKWFYGSIYCSYGRWVSVSPDAHEKYVLDFPHPTGKWVEWYPSGGIHLEENWLHGKRHGVWREWYEDGILWSESHYAEDELDGPYTIWLENGQKGSERFYKHGVLEGKQTRWYKNGKKRYEREVRNGQQVYAVSYAPDGHKAAELLGPNPTGKWVEWFSNGQEECEGYYLEGHMHGKWTSWSKEGSLHDVRWYERGIGIAVATPELQAWQEQMDAGSSKGLSTGGADKP